MVYPVINPTRLPDGDMPAYEAEIWYAYMRQQRPEQLTKLEAEAVVVGEMAEERGLVLVEGAGDSSIMPAIVGKERGRY